MRRNFMLSFILTLISSWAMAQAPALLPFQGRVTDASGNTVNYTVTIKFQILPPSGICYLYEDTQTVTPNDFGVFSVLLGDASHKTFPAGAFNFNKVFENTTTNILATNCGTYTPTVTDWRRIQIVVDGYTLADVQTIASSPYALHAQYIGGKTASDLIQVNGDVTQTNLATLTGAGDASALHHHDSIYARTDSGNSFAGAVTSGVGFFAPSATGSIGVGTSTTAADVHVKKGSPSFRMEMLSGGAGTGSFDFFSGATQRASIKSSETTNQLTFQTGTTTALTLDANQNAQFAGNVMASGFMAPGRYTNAQETSLQTSYLTGCGFGCLGTIWGNTTSNEVHYWDGSSVRTIPKFSPVPYVNGGVVISSATQMSVLSPGTNGQVLTVNGSGIPAWATPTAGTLTSITAGTGLTGGTITTSGTIAVDVGTAAGKILQMDGTAKIPAVDGSQLTNVDAVKLQGRAVSVTAPALGSIMRYNVLNSWEKFDCAAGNVLKWNAVTGWDCGADIDTTPADASYIAKGLVQFDADAATSGINITGGVAKLATSGVTAATYGSASSVPVVVVDSFGRITSASGTAYQDATGAAKGIVQVGSNISVSSGTISITNPNVIAALGFTPLNKAGDVMSGNLGLNAISSDPTGLAVADKGKVWYNTISSQIKYWDGTTAVALGAAGAGMTSLGGQTASTQTFAAGSAGNSPAIASASNIHTLNVPLASASGSVTSGTISNADYMAFNAKLGTSTVFSGDVSGTASTTSVDQIKGRAVTAASATGQMMIYNGTAWVNNLMSGDATMPSTGVITIANNAVTTAKINAGAVTAAKLDSTGANGELFIGNGAGFTKSTLTAGTGVTITNASGGITINATGTGGTVTSVGVAVPAYMTTSGGPITTSGNVTLGFGSQSAKNVFAAPQGSAGAPGFRLLNIADVQSVNGGNFLTGGTCGAGQALTYSSVTDTIACSTVTSAISNAATLANTKIWVGDGTSKAQEVNISGDATLANTGALTLVSTIVPGSAGSASSVPAITYDAKGRLTAVSASAYQDATGAAKGIVQIGSNITVSSGSISVTNSNALAAIGYTPLNKAGDVMTGNLGLNAISSDPTGLAVADKGKVWYNTISSQIKYWDGSAAIPLGAAGAGLTSLGGQTSSTQTFAAGSAGNAPAINSASNVHTLDVPLASASGSVTSGTISNSDYVAFSAKLGSASVFSGDVSGTSTTTSVDKIKGRAVTAASATGQMMIYNGTAWINNLMSGDATMPSTGVLTIANNAVTTAKVNAGAITAAKLDSTGANGELFIGNGAGFTKATLTAGTGVTITNASGGITINATGTGGTVTSVTATAPVASTGGTAPVISMAAANTTTDGYLTSTNWNTFNNKLGTATVFSGDVSGTASTTSVDQIKGRAVTAASATGQMMIYNGTAWVNNLMSGDATMPSTGVLTIANNAVTTAKINANAVTAAKLESAANGEIFIGNGTGFTKSTLTAGTGVTISNASGGITINATGTGGTVTSVGGTAPISSTGGTAPVLSMAAANTTTDGYLTSANWNIFNNKLGTATVFSGDVSGTASTTSVDQIKGRAVAAASATGQMMIYNGSAWVNNLMSGDATMPSTGVLTIANNAVTTAKVNAGAITAAKLDTTGANGELFIGNGAGFTKAALTAGAGVTITNAAGGITIAATGAGTVTSVTGTAPVVSSGGASPAISMAAANTTTDGYLTSANWNTFNNKLGTATVFSGDVTGTASTTSVDQIKGRAVTAASATGQMMIYNGSAWVNNLMSGDATMPSTGVLTIANNAVTTAKINANAVTAAKLESAANGEIFIGNGTGFTKSTLTAGSGVAITNGSGGITITATGSGGSVTSVGVAVPAYMTTSGGPVTTSGDITLGFGSQTAKQVFMAPAAGGAPTFRNFNVSDLLSSVAGTFLTGTTCGAGAALTYNATSDTMSCNTIVPTVSNTSALGNTQIWVGDAGSKAQAVNVSGDISLASTGVMTVGNNAITTAKVNAGAITAGKLDTSAANGELFIGNGAGFSKATLTAGTGVTITNAAGGITIAATGAGTVTSVTGTAPVVSSGGASPAISMAAANTTTDGYLTSANWNTFNNKLGTATVFSGDVSGTASTTSVDQIKGRAVAAASATGQMMIYNGTAWVNNLMSGDATMPSTGVLTIANNAVTTAKINANAVTAAKLESAANGEIFIGNGTGFTKSTLTAGTGVTITNAAGGITINATGAGAVTSVTGTAPVVSSGGATPAISMAAANTTTDGYLTSANWNTFNNKLGTATVFSGDVSGTASTTSVDQIKGRAVTAASATGQMMIYNGTAWVNNLMSGDATMPSTGVLTIANSAITTAKINDNSVTAAKLESASNGQLFIGNGTGFTKAALTAGAGVTITNASGGITIAATGGGTVTSVGVAVPAYMTTSGGPVTTSGDITLGFGSQTAKQVFMAPAAGGAPTFRNFVISDLLSSVAGTFLTGTTCGAGAALTYNATSDTISCNTIVATVGNTATLNSAKIWVGDGSNKAQEVSLSGDATLSNAGAMTLKNTGTSGTYYKVTTDAQGRVTSGSNLVSSDVTTALAYTPVNKAGDTMSGVLNLPSNGLVAGTSQLVISGGSVGINTASPSATYKLDVSGDMRATGYFYASDRNLKENFQELKGLETVLRLHGVKFDWKENGKPDVGLIAQEVEKVLPQLVVTDPVTGLKAVKYGNLVAPLIESTKELYGMCLEQKRKISSLEERMDKLEKENEELRQAVKKLLNSKPGK